MTKFKHDVVRDYNGCGGVNFGELSLYAVNGHLFACEANREHLHKLSPIEVDVFPSFVYDVCLHVTINDNGNDFYVYALKLNSLGELGEQFSSMFSRRVTAVASARVLASWENGEMVGEPKLLSHFYSDISAEEDSAVKFW